jgi:aromatic ring hydroxylase
MVRAGKRYIDSIRDEREVSVNGERVKDVPTCFMLRPLPGVRARVDTGLNPREERHA